MPRWLCWWAEKDEQDEVNVAELLEQVERQRAIIEEQARNIEAWKAKEKQWEDQSGSLRRYHDAITTWLCDIPDDPFETKEVTE
jgi:hypothetical protein